MPITPERGNASGRALLEGRTVHIPDVEADPDYSFDTAGTGFRSVLGVPMLREGAPIGVLALARSDVRPFTDKQIDLVSTFADQAAIAIENVRLFEEIQDKNRQLAEASQHKSQFLASMSHELRESLQQQTATADVLKVISRSTFDLKSVLQTLVESAARLCDADKGNITRQVDGVFYRAEFYGFPAEVIGCWS